MNATAWSGSTAPAGGMQQARSRKTAGVNMRIAVPPYYATWMQAMKKKAPEAPSSISHVGLCSFIDSVDGTLVDGKRGFVHRLRQGRMGMDGALQVFGAGAELHGHHRLGDHLRGHGPHDVHAQDLVVVRMGQHLHHAD